MAKSPTLLDDLYQNTFKVDRLKYLRPLILSARKFVLDTEMSSFLADLAIQGFKGTKSSSYVYPAGSPVADIETIVDLAFEESRKRTEKSRLGLIENMRHSARLPFPVTWIEFDHHALFKRRKELAPEQVTSEPEQTCKNEGWLLVQHPGLDTVFHSTLVFGDIINQDRYMPGLPAPYSWAWSCDDETHLPYAPVAQVSSENHCRIPVGISDYNTPFVKIIYRPGLEKKYQDPHEIAGFDHMFLKEFVGDLRYTWALLATLNDLPVENKIVETSKGFLGRGKFRKFLTHSLITLKVPTKESRVKLARKLIALSRRRRHEVRGHFRKDWRNPLEKIWIPAHERGDATLGFVTHSYKVERNKENA